MAYIKMVDLLLIYNENWGAICAFISEPKLGSSAKDKVHNLPIKKGVKISTDRLLAL